MYGVCFPTRGVSEGFHEGLYKEKNTLYIQESPILAVYHQFVLNPANDLFDVVLNDS